MGLYYCEVFDSELALLVETWSLEPEVMGSYAMNVCGLAQIRHHHLHLHCTLPIFLPSKTL